MLIDGELKKAKNDEKSVKILVVDDQEMLRSIMKAVLKHGGFDVVEAIDGADAIRKHVESDGSLDLVLMDVQMPGLSGREAWAQIREREPTLPVLFLSGGMEIDSETGGSWLDGVNFLPKPFDNQELLGRVRGLLGVS